MDEKEAKEDICQRLDHIKHLIRDTKFPEATHKTKELFVDMAVAYTCATERGNEERELFLIKLGTALMGETLAILKATIEKEQMVIRMNAEVMN